MSMRSKPQILTQSLTRFGLVQRLRMVFALIVLVIGTAVFLSLWQFKSLENVQNNLLGTSVPVLVQTQSVERALHDLLIQLGQIEVAPDNDTLTLIEQSVNDQFSNARRSVVGLGQASGSDLQTDVILNQMTEMETGIHTNIAIKRGLFRTEGEISSHFKRLLQLQRDIRFMVENLSFEAAERMDQGVLEVLSSHDEDAAEIAQRLQDQTQQVNLIGHLALELETIANVVGQVGQRVSQENLKNMRDFVGFRMRGALQQIVRLPVSPERTELSLLVNDLRQAIFGPRGILNLIDENSASTRDLVQQNAKQQIVVREISSATERLMADAHNRLTQAGRLTQFTTQRLILILGISAITVSIIVMLSILIIVERQINARIGVLTESVLRIAAGDTDHKTNVAGRDELGRMSDALEIFKRNARELLRSNAELEKFAYAAAHDLRSPLQAIRDLTVWTIEDEDNSLSPDSAENLQLLQERVSRLSTLLGDLLQYARIGADIADSLMVDWDEVVFETVAMADPQGTLQVSHDWDGAQIETYLHPLQKILLNLLSNSLKHGGSGKGQIHILSRIREGRLRVEYTDDGPGIPQEYHTKVFELFQTLKPRDEMEGSGLGLAISKKLIEHFEGTIEIRSNPDIMPGTTFVFDFPVGITDEFARAA